MSGECNVCGQNHPEINHCVFKEEFDEIQIENIQLRKIIKELIEEVKDRANAGSWWNDQSVYDLVRKYEQILKE